MQYILCNSALLARKTLFLTQKGTVFQIYKSFGIWEDPPHVGKNFQIISFFLTASLNILEKNSYDDNKKVPLYFWTGKILKIQKTLRRIDKLKICPLNSVY